MSCTLPREELASREHHVQVMNKLHVLVPIIQTYSVTPWEKAQQFLSS